MSIATLAIKSNALGLPVNGLACYGISVEVFDTGSIHHRRDAVISAFDIPTGTATNNVSASVVLRSQSPVAGAGLTGYTLSWGWNADGSVGISCFRWSAGTPTQVATTVVTGVPAPTVGATFSGQISGSTLTAFIAPSGGTPTQYASFTDATITAGTFSGLHFFRNVAASNCYVTNTIAYAVAAPVTPPPPPPGTRNPAWNPGPPTNPFVVSFGDGSTFGSVGFAPGGDPVKSFRLGLTVNGAGYAVVAQNQDPPGDVEAHTANILADGFSEYETYGSPISYTAPTINLKTDMLSYTGMGAAKWAFIFGCIRKVDMDSGVIAHALNIFLENGDLGTGGGGFVAPAWGADANFASTYGSGPYRIGSRVGIPWATTKPALSVQGSMVWDCMKTYGAFVTNRAGNTSLTVESLPGDAWAQALRNSGDMTRIYQACRLLTNGNAGNSYAGPIVVARRGPDPAPFG